MLYESKYYRLILSAMFLALALVLPLLTGQIQQFGQMLCPMHIPVLLCGFFCGPWYALSVGFIAPLLRFLVFGMPPLMPVGIAMCFELAAYGLTAGLLYKLLPKKTVNVYVSLAAAMLAGRIVWGAARYVMLAFGKAGFGWKAFFTGAFADAVPGIAVQIVLIPLIVIVLRKYTVNR